LNKEIDVYYVGNSKTNTHKCMRNYFEYYFVLQVTNVDEKEIPAKLADFMTKYPDCKKIEN